MAPVGSYESLAAAIQAGADAVYFGVGKLNMRSASAANFSLDDLARIVATAHAAGVKAYLTVNTVVYEEEITTVHEVIDRARAEGVDAVIASDMAAILYARRIGQEVHISTQCNISNSEAVKFYAQWADTVVLARELSLEQVAEIRRRIEAEALDFFGLLVTDAVRENSELLAVGSDDIMRNLPYEPAGPELFALPGVLSRKKQLLPQILAVTAALQQD